MAKILISFLGTGSLNPSESSTFKNYRTAKYSVENTVIGESSFISSVLMDHYKYDSMVLLGTCKSMWDAIYEYYSAKNYIEPDVDFYFQISKFISESNYLTIPDNSIFKEIEKVLPINSKIKIIPYGLNKEEQLQIFTILKYALSDLKNGDEIILDITHSFRSIPLFATSVINYIKTLSDKKIVFNKVFYGMLEASSDFQGITPIVDISSTIELQNWSNAAFSFKEYGKGSLLANLLEGEPKKVIQIFSDAVNLNNLHQIRTKLTNFQSLSKQDLGNEFANIFLPDLLESFVKRLNKLSNKMYLFQFELSKWHREKENYATSYIVFIESILTYVCEKYNHDYLVFDNRENAKDEILFKNIFGLKSIYKESNIIRNDIVHNKNRPVKNDIKLLSKFHSDFEAIVKNNPL